jgi:hypothetical protein
MGKRLSKQDMDRQADEILKVAESYDVQGNFFFVTTFKRYLEQINILSQLEEAYKEHGPTVEKEYVKGRKNICINPALNEYNKTSTAANQTVTTLMKIINEMKDNDEDAAKELMAFINGNSK